MGCQRGRWALTVAAVDLSTSGLMALQRGNAKSAAALFDLVVRAAPKDPLPAYNAACAYARVNQRDLSLAMLGKALNRGFRDANLPRESFSSRLRHELQEALGLGLGGTDGGVGMKAGSGLYC